MSLHPGYESIHLFWSHPHRCVFHRMGFPEILGYLTTIHHATSWRCGCITNCAPDEQPTRPKPMRIRRWRLAQVAEEDLETIKMLRSGCIPGTWMYRGAGASRKLCMGRMPPVGTSQLQLWEPPTDWVTVRAPLVNQTRYRCWDVNSFCG